MKKSLLLILALIMTLSLTGCEKVMHTEEDFIARVRKEINSPDADTMEVQYIGALVYEREEALLWFMTGNEYQAHRLIPMQCTLAKDGGYVFKHAPLPLDRGEDIVVLPGHGIGGYAFCINNPDCKTLRIEDVSGVTEVEVTEYPFIYYNPLLPGEYTFLDADGNALR